MLEAPERGALFGRGLGVERVDLDDIARAVGLVGVFCDVETLIRRLPAISPALGAYAVTLERGANLDVGVAR